MSSDRARMWPRAVLVVGVVAYLAAVVVTLVQLRSYEIATLVAFGTYLLVGGLIVLRRGNALGLFLVAYGASRAVVDASIVTTDTLDAAGRAAATEWVTLGATVLSNASLWLIPAMWLIFPEGRTQTRTDRRLLRVCGAFATIVAVGSVFVTPQTLPETEAYPHPFVDDQVADTLRVILMPAVVLSFLFGLFTAARLVIRMRHGNLIERRQAGWIAVAVIVSIAILLTNAAVAPLGTDDRSFLLIDAVAVVLVPLAVGVAIMRYRLYEIDRIIGRSVTYGVLAAFTGGVYVAIVVGLGASLGGDAGFGLSIVATALVAIAFQPMRRWVERWANRLVYGERATPHETLVQFSHRSSELSDDELIEQVPKLIVDGTGAKSAALWVRSDEVFRAASTWPTASAARSLVVGDSFNDDEADRSWPVRHDGELLGGISLTKERGDTVTPSEATLLADLAAGLGLVLRNTRLTNDLRRQVATLEASRERVLAAADAARRELEYSLDRGPQQQLVAVKVKLGPTRKRAEQLGANKTAALLAQLEQQAGEAIITIREFARGVHPPLLAAEGLAAAIGQHGRSSALAVSVRSNGLGRYSSEVESAVYFAVLEALQNTAKYAHAKSATVRLTAVNGTLDFEIADDGSGFDPTTVGPGTGLGGIADRLDTVGGTLTVSSDPGRGTRVAGSVPTEARVGV